MATKNHYTIELPTVGGTALEALSWMVIDWPDWDAKEYSGCGCYFVGWAAKMLRARQAVERIAWFFKREFGYDFCQYSATPDSGTDLGRDLAFLWISPRSYRMCGESLDVIGAGCFRWREWKGRDTSYGLQWVWLHPYERNKGHLTQAWPALRRRFAPFLVEAPYSTAMESFLKKMGDWTDGPNFVCVSPPPETARKEGER